MPGEKWIRLASFCAALALVAFWEIILPRRPLADQKSRHWRTNLCLVAIDSAAVRYLMPLLPAGLAVTAQQRGWGVLNVVVVPYLLRVCTSVVLLDFCIYLQHVLFHFLPILWRLHRVHHTDLDIDVTTGNRFHPLEIVVSIGIKLAAVALIGPPVIAVVVFESVLNATSQFNHGNIRLPERLDRWLRLVLVTPDMHRVHHSVIVRETNSNFGFNLPWWDRLCGTYCPEPEMGQAGMTIGLKEFRDPQRLTLLRLLIQPFER